MDPVEEYFLNEISGDTDEEEDLMLLAECSRSSEPSKKEWKRRSYLDREREAGHNRIFNDYFTITPVYSAQTFRRRYRMRKELFLRIMEAVQHHSNYFKLRCDATGRKGLSPLQKCTAALRQLAYGAAADQYDEVIRISECSAIQSLNKFCRCVIEIFGPQYFRKPNSEDVERLMRMHSERHGFPGMLGSIDCMHWKWKNCPVAWKEQFTRGDQGAPTIMLEAVASADLWIWHAFFGVAGSNNDINVLNQSPLFNDMLQGSGPNVEFMVNGNKYTNVYYLADGIYPEWATLVKSYSYPEDEKRKKFKEMQEASRKDVERAFGVLQSRWAIVRGPARSWEQSKLSDIMYACIILHNMIVEDEKDDITNWDDDEGEPPITVNQGHVPNFQQYLQRNAELRDREIHHRLRSDLVEHIWECFGDIENED